MVSSIPHYNWNLMGAPDANLPLFDQEGETFESLARTNGTRYWFARDLMRMLGYDSWSAFRQIINKALVVCTTAGIMRKRFQLARVFGGSLYLAMNKPRQTGSSRKLKYRPMARFLWD